MATFGACRTGHILCQPRDEFLRQLRRHRKLATFRGDEARRERVVTEIRKARLTEIRVAVPVEAPEARMAELPEEERSSSRRTQARPAHASTREKRAGGRTRCRPGCRSGWRT